MAESSQSFALHEFLLMPFFHPLAFCNANKKLGRGQAAAALIPLYILLTKIRLGVAFQFPMFPTFPSSVVSPLTLKEIFGHGSVFVWLA